MQQADTPVDRKKCGIKTQIRRQKQNSFYA